MASQRKAEANRKNARLSTGPKSESGKTIVAGNAVRHGIWTHLPVIPGVERPEDWEAHRDGVLQSLAPVGTLEVRLAERVALLLWRLERVARYETAVVAACLEKALADGPPEEGGFLTRTSDAEKLKDIEKRLARKRESLGETLDALDLMRRLDDAPDDLPVSYGGAFRALESAYGALPDGDGVAWVEDEEFLTPLGVPPEDGFDDVRWTAGLVRRGLASLAGDGGLPPDKLTARTVAGLEEYRNTLEEGIAEDTREAQSLERKLQARADKRLAYLGLPDEVAEGKILRYEAHLNRQLIQALHELERLQSGRAGRHVPPPVAIDVALDVTGAQGVGLGE